MPPRGGHRGGGHGGGGHHHHGGHRRGRGGYPSFGPGWGWGGGYLDYPGTELFVVESDEAIREKERIAKYLASLPEKERATAFAKIYGSPSATSGFEVAGVSVGSFVLGAVVGWVAAGMVVKHIIKTRFPGMRGSRR